MGQIRFGVALGQARMVSTAHERQILEGTRVEAGSGAECRIAKVCCDLIGVTVRLLNSLLASSTDSIVLSVACHDVGNFVKNYSMGKWFLQELGIKQKVMELMTHDNAEVRYNALLAVQYIMVNAWD